MSTLVATGHESALRMLQTMRLCPGTNVEFACTTWLDRTERVSQAWGHRQVLLNMPRYIPLLDILIYLIDDRLDQDTPDGEFDAQAVVLLYSSADRRFDKCEDVVLNSFACNYEDHLVTRVEMRVTSLTSRW